MSLRFIDKYEIVSTLGRGSMGVVYKAKDPEIGRLVAIKTLKSVFMGDDAAGNEALQRFRQESRSAGKLHHPNIVTIFEAGRTENGSPYIVMEYIEGKSLETQLAEGGAVDPMAALHYLAQISSAVDYAHSQNVIHRDIKPSNILVDARHRPYLLDFGVAKLSDTSLTPAGTVVGTPSYMSPEQIRGAQLDGRTDLFSLAVVTFEVFTGSRPFPGADFTTVVSNIIHKDPLTFSDVACALPEGLEHVLRGGLSKDREKRPASALEFVDACARIFGVMIDGSGIIGGYTPGMKVPEKSASRPAVVATATAEHTAAYGAQVAGGGEAVSAAGGAAAWEENPSSATLLDQTRLQPGPVVPAVEPYTNGASQAVEAAQPLNVKKTAPVADDVAFLKDTRGAATPSSSRQDSGGQGGRWFWPIAGLIAVVLLAVVGMIIWPRAQELLASRNDGSAESEVSTSGSSGADEYNSSSSNGSALPPMPPPASESSSTSVPSSPGKTAPSVTEPVKAVPPPPPIELSKNGLTPVRPVITGGGLSEGAISLFRPEELLWVLGDSSIDLPSLRLCIAEAGRRSMPELTAALIGLKAHSDFKVRIEVLKALSQLRNNRDPQVVQVLVEALSDNEFLVRGFAAKVLRAVPEPSVLPALEARLAEEKNALVSKVITDSVNQLKNSGAPAR